MDLCARAWQADYVSTTEAEVTAIARAQLDKCSDKSSESERAVEDSIKARWERCVDYTYL